MYVYVCVDHVTIKYLTNLYVCVCVCVCSLGSGDAVRGRHERGDGTQANSPMAILPGGVQVQAGGEDGSQTTPRLCGVHGE